MNNRERVKAILHYEPTDQIPVVHFGFWNETLLKWHAEGHLTEEESKTYYEGCLSIWKGRAAEKAKAMGCCEGTPCNNNCPRFGVEE